MGKKVIKETTVLKLPLKDQERLKALCGNDGMEPSMHQATGLSIGTIRRIKDTGRGELRSLRKILDFINTAEKEIDSLFSEEPQNN